MKDKEMDIETMKENLLICDWNDPTEKRYRERIKSPLTAIRAMCVVCVGAQLQEVNKCTKFNCPAYPYRKGKDPFHGNSKAMKKDRK